MNLAKYVSGQVPNSPTLLGAAKLENALGLEVADLGTARRDPCGEEGCALGIAANRKTPR